MSNFSICWKHLVTRSQPATFSYSTFSSSLAARGRGCLSLCALHQEKSACTAKELWVSGSLHGNIWQLVAVTATKQECWNVLFSHFFVVVVGMSVQWAHLIFIIILNVHPSPGCFFFVWCVWVSRVLVSLQDTVIYDRLADSSRYKEITLKHLEQFATEGEWLNIAPWWPNVEFFNVRFVIAGHYFLISSFHHISMFK